MAIIGKAGEDYQSILDQEKGGAQPAQQVARLQRHHAVHFHGGQDLGLGEPAAVLQFRLIRRHVQRHRLGITADHQRMRHRPGLRGVIADTADMDARFFQGFATHGVFDRLPRFDEAGETGIHARRKMMTAAEQA